MVAARSAHNMYIEDNARWIKIGCGHNIFNDEL